MTGGDEVEAGLAPLATILATVELERALIEQGAAAGARDTAVDDPLLGAAVVLVSTPDGLLALAEPTAEGRLAASLARHGEGPAGRYAALAEDETLDAFRRRAAELGVATSRVAFGPFGPAVLVLTGPVSGPHLIVVERRPLPSPA